MEIFKLIGSIFIKTDDAEQSIDETTKKVQNMASTLGKKMTAVGTTMSNVGQKLAPVSLAVGGLAVSAVKASAEVKAMNSQFEQTFGSLQDQASDAMNRVATESGILQTRLQGVGTSIYAFAKSSGADSAEAMSLMEEALRATADASAYYDRSLEETSESLMSFLKGNFANDAQLGVSCTETTRNAKAMELFGQKYNDLSEIQKQQTLLKMVTDAQALSGAMGQASRESDGFENVMGNLKESLKQLGASFGETVLPAVVSFIQGLTGLIQKFSEMDSGTKKIIMVIAGLVAGLSPVLIVVGNVISAVGTLMTTFSKMSGLIKTGVTAVKGLGSALGFLTSPVGLVIAGITALVAGFIYLWNNCEGFREFWINLWENIKEIASTVIDAIVNFFTGLWDSIKEIASNIAEAVSTAWENIKTTTKNIFDGVVEVVSNAWDTICNVVEVAGMFLGEIIGLFFDIITIPFRFIWENCKESVTEAFTSIKETVSNAFTAVKDKVTEIGGNIKDKCSEVFDNVKDKVTTVWDTVKTNTVQAWNDMKVSYEEGGGGIAGITEVWFDAVKNSVCNALDFISQFTGINLDGLKTAFTDAWFTIRNAVVDVLYNIQTTMSEVWTAVTTWLTTKFEEIKTLFTTVWTSIQTFVSDTFTKIKTAITTAMDAIKTTLTNVWNAIKSFVTGALDAIKTKVTAVWDNIKSKVTSVMDGVKSAISNGLNSAKNTVSSILDAIKNKFQSIWDNCKNIVSNAVEKCKSLMNFSWSLPKLKLPHLSITGSFSINPPSVPKFSIAWYKHGGIMLDPTIFGMNGNKLMAGGEAGEEAIAPIDLLLGYIRTAVAEQNASLIQALKDAIEDLGSKMSDKTEGDIIIPVYIGDTLIDDIIVNSKKNIILRSGGLTSV